MSKKWFEWFMIATACFALGASMCSCTAEDDPLGEGACMLGDCSVTMKPDPANQPDAYQDSNGYWHIKYYGANYFSIKASYSPLKNRYMVGGVPTIYAYWDTSYWYRIAGEVLMWASSYTPFGDFTNNWTYAIANNTYQISIENISEIDEIMNISGQYMRNGILGPDIKTKPYTKLYTKFVASLFPEMVGDTITIWNESHFAYDSDQKVEILSEIKVIVE